MNTNYNSILKHATFIKNQKIINQEDTSYKELETDIFLVDSSLEDGVIFSDEYGVLVEKITLHVDNPARLKSLVEKSEQRIHDLGGKYYEIWHKDHNVNDVSHGGIHLPDPYGEPSDLIDTMICELQKNSFDVVDPKYNHNKVSSRKCNKFDLNENHIDSFEGYRLDDSGKRVMVWRYLINLREEPRTTCFCPYGRDDIDLIPKEYSEKLFDLLFEKINKRLQHCVVTTPPANYQKGEFYGIKILVTHVLHSEYGEKDDFLLVVNSLV